MRKRGIGFETEELLAPDEAVAVFFERVALAPPPIEEVPLDEALGRVLARRAVADDDYPNVMRSAMDGFALAADAAPGRFIVLGDVRMGVAPRAAVARGSAMRIPTGGVLPPGTDAVVPIEDVRDEGASVVVSEPLAAGANAIEPGADMRRGETILSPGRWIGAPALGLLAALGVASVPVYRRPIVAVLSSGDELVQVWARPEPGEVRNSNQYAVAGALRAMGAQPRFYPLVRDESADFEAALGRALDECDAVAITGGTSVGERDRLPETVARLGPPGIVAHGLRIKPGKPTLLGAVGGKPVLGLPGNPASALLVLAGVAAPIVGALVGGQPPSTTVAARLGSPLVSRPGWTWYVSVVLENDGGLPLAHPLAVRSFSVSLTARADGYLVMGERDEELPAGTLVTVHRFPGA